MQQLTYFSTHENGHLSNNLDSQSYKLGNCFFSVQSLYMFYSAFITPSSWWQYRQIPCLVNYSHLKRWFLFKSSVQTNENLEQIYNLKLMPCPQFRPCQWIENKYFSASLPWGTFTNLFANRMLWETALLGVTSDLIFTW